SRDKRTFLTGPLSEKISHGLRHEHQAILVGSGTILADDPQLNVRAIEGRNPLRIILKGDRELPKDAAIFRDENFLVLENKNVEEILKELHEKGITSVLVEGGKEVLESFFSAEVIDEFHFFYAPKILGQKSLGLSFNENDLSFSQISVRKSGRDVYLRLKAEWDSGKA
ncbi:MAG: RibD family protein, partial [Patescibacteria group bacterium]